MLSRPIEQHWSSDKLSNSVAEVAVQSLLPLKGDPLQPPEPIVVKSLPAPPDILRLNLCILSLPPA